MSPLGSLVRVVEHQVRLQVAKLRGKDANQLELQLGLLSLPATFLTDFLLGQFLISPLVTMCWRSVWLLADSMFDRLLLPENKTAGFIISLVLGMSLTIICRFIIFVPSTFLSSTYVLAQFAFTRLFSVIYFCSYMMLWRGWWNLLALLRPPPSLLLSLALSIQLLTSSLPSNVGPPLSFSHDTKKHYLQLPVFNQCRSPLLNILTTSVLEVFVILCWFSTWSLLDSMMDLLTPSKTHDLLLSLSLGFTSGLIAFSLQLPLLYYLKSDRPRQNTRTLHCQNIFTKLCYDFLCILGLTSTVASLRGYWMFQDLVFQDDLWLSMYVPAVIGFTSLLSLKLLSSLHGGVVAGEDRPALFPSWLLTYWLVSETDSSQHNIPHISLQENSVLIDRNNMELE